MIAQSASFKFNRILYGGFVLFSVVQMIIYRDLLEGLPMLGIALAFDPFDQKVKLGDRPLYQRVWLITHVSVFFVLFGYEIITKILLK